MDGIEAGDVVRLEQPVLKGSLHLEQVPGTMQVEHAPHEIAEHGVPFGPTCPQHDLQLRIRPRTYDLKRLVHEVQRGLAVSLHAVQARYAESRHRRQDGCTQLAVARLAGEPVRQGEAVSRQSRQTLSKGIAPGKQRCLSGDGEQAAPQVVGDALAEEPPEVGQVVVDAAGDLRRLLLLTLNFEVAGDARDAVDQRRRDPLRLVGEEFPCILKRVSHGERQPAGRQQSEKLPSIRTTHDPIPSWRSRGFAK